MRITKQHTEFAAVDMNLGGWHSPPGYPEDIEQRSLAGSLDETNRTGNRTRLLRFRPGASTAAPVVHDYWEEVFVISGDLIVLDANNPANVQSFRQNTYACRPRGIRHGPFRS